ncbi:MAG: NnrS family protein [Mariprofundales bacterium]|nr:NnrS family protein [Mariprofundales bacterium]
MIANAHSVKPRFALFELGFRPLFFVAGLFAVVSMVLWMLDLLTSIRLLPLDRSPALWHAHAMIYGYALAVIAGFLLTAVRNWTGQPTLHDRSLQGLVALWLLARVAPFVAGPYGLWLAMAADNLFILYLSVALTIPVVRAKKWKNLGVISKIYFFLIGNILFDLGLLGWLEGGTRLGIYLGFYMVLSLILVLARRVIPMFIRNGIDLPYTPQNRLWVDISAFLLFLAFMVLDLFAHQPRLAALVALVLALLHAIRLAGWFPFSIWSAIWRKPLLWVLLLAYGWMVVGFALTSAAQLGLCPPFLALHAFAVGGISMMTMGMMARVAWGHSGRDLNAPPSGLGILFGLLAASAVMRVVVPMLLPAGYAWWIGCAQLLWIAAFGGFLLRYTPVLWRPRVSP